MKDVPNIIFCFVFPPGGVGGEGLIGRPARADTADTFTELRDGRMEGRGINPLKSPLRPALHREPQLSPQRPPGLHGCPPSHGEAAMVSQAGVEAGWYYEGGIFVEGLIGSR
jgi:hypothetical protein